LNLAKLGIKSYLADYSVSSPPVFHPKIDFLKKFIGIVNNDKYIRIEDWIKSREAIDNNISGR